MTVMYVVFAVVAVLAVIASVVGLVLARPSAAKVIREMRAANERSTDKGGAESNQLGSTGNRPESEQTLR